VFEGDNRSAVDKRTVKFLHTVDHAHTKIYLWNVFLYITDYKYVDGIMYWGYRWEMVVYVSIDIMHRSGSLKSNIDGPLSTSSIIT
jgi:hypothetical protein